MPAGYKLVDLIAISFVFFYAAITFKRGFFSQFFEFLGLAISLISAISFVPIVSNAVSHFGLDSELTNPFIFVSIFIVSELLFLTFFRYFFKELPMDLLLSNFNRTFGLIPNILSGLLILSFVSTVAILLPMPTNVKTAITNSGIVGNILPFTSRFSAPLEQAFSRSIRESIVAITSSKQDSDSFVRLTMPGHKTTLDQNSEEQLFVFLNETRQERNLTPLVSDSTLVKVARNHSKSMIEESYFGHYDPKGKSPLDRVISENLSFNSLAENLSFAPDAATAQEGFLRSSEHLASMVSTKYTRVGIGVYDTEKYGKMFTEMFAD